MDLFVAEFATRRDIQGRIPPVATRPVPLRAQPLSTLQQLLNWQVRLKPYRCHHQSALYHSGQESRGGRGHRER
ncbi:hypothetical protein TNCV_1104931 [Trichonephila clavipes]|nr:hypothetical protein TNCV_1104931 [Trichonephila clavipes]